MLFGCALQESLNGFFHKNSAKQELPKPAPKPQEDELRASNDFVQGSEDVPLMFGMSRVFDDSLGFDSAIGSISSSSYLAPYVANQVQDFYAKTLPQMGWKMQQSDAIRSVFVRDSEKLVIEFMQQENRQVVSFFISSSL